MPSTTSRHPRSISRTSAESAGCCSTTFSTISAQLATGTQLGRSVSTFERLVLVEADQGLALLPACEAVLGAGRRPVLAQPGQDLLGGSHRRAQRDVGVQRDPVPHLLKL